MERRGKLVYWIVGIPHLSPTPDEWVTGYNAWGGAEVSRTTWDRAFRFTSKEEAVRMSNGYKVYRMKIKIKKER